MAGAKGSAHAVGRGRRREEADFRPRAELSSHEPPLLGYAALQN